MPNIQNTQQIPAEARPYVLAAETDQKQFEKVMAEAADFVMIILRAHLHFENQLERIIRTVAPRGDLLVDDSQIFSFAQKLLLVEAHNVVGREVVSCLRGLNTVRNRCVHDLAKQLTDADIVKIGSPLGKVLTTIRRNAQFEELATLRLLISHIAGAVSYHVFVGEHGREAARYLKHFDDTQQSDSASTATTQAASKGK